MQTGSKLGNEYIKAVCCHLTYSTYMQSTSYEMPGWMKHSQGCMLSPCLFNLHAEYIIRNARLNEAQARIKTAGRTISNLSYADDTTLMSESKEELKSLLIKVKEQIDGETMERVTRLYFLGSPKSLQMVTAAMK